MRHYLNKGHIQFDLIIGSSVEQIIGKMIHADQEGCIIEQESDGVLHGYSWQVIMHACEAP